VPLLLIDLDDTLLDRADAFLRWAKGFLVSVAAAPMDIDWLIEADDAGRTPKDQLAVAVRDRYRLGADVDVVALLAAGLLAELALDDDVRAALGAARSAGVTVIVVTNGTVAMQEQKIRRTGLDECVDGWVISEAVGAYKPDPRIFEAAAAAGGGQLTGGWMIGDNPTADIVGASRLGLTTVWLSHGRSWPDPDCRPTHLVESCAEAIRLAVRALT
jgi:putative hydrolase of the HAD superfamily